MLPSDKRESDDMTEKLNRECQTFSRYLTQQAPSDYLVSQYRQFHATDRAAAFEADPFDRFLVAFACRHRWFTRVADTYASRFRKQAALRAKLVLMLALLESAPPSCDYVDRVESGGRAVFIRLGLQGVVYIITLVVSAVILLPAQVILSRSARA